MTSVGDEKRVALYARFGDRENPESHLMHWRQYAAARGWKVVGEYVDRVTGGTAWREILDLAAQRRIDLIVVARLDLALRASLSELLTDVPTPRPSPS